MGEEILISVLVYLDYLEVATVHFLDQFVFDWFWDSFFLVVGCFVEGYWGPLALLGDLAEAIVNGGFWEETHLCALELAHVSALVGTDLLSLHVDVFVLKGLLDCKEGILFVLGIWGECCIEIFIFGIGEV